MSIDMDATQLQNSVNSYNSITYNADNKLVVRDFILAQKGIIKLTVNTPVASVFFTLRPTIFDGDVSYTYKTFEGSASLTFDLTAIGGTGFNQIIVSLCVYGDDVRFISTILPIIDYYTKTQINNNFYTKTEVDNAIQTAIGNVLNGEF